MSDDNIIHVDFGPRGGRRVLVKRPPPTEPPGVDERPRAKDPLGDLYTSRDVARLFSISESRLRYWEKSGFLRRSGEAGERRYYTFQDLIGIRVAKGLLDHGIALRQVRRSLEALRGNLPRVSRPLSSLRITAEGQTVVVKDEQGAYDPTTGQLQLDFDVSALRDDVVRVLRRGGTPNDHRLAYEAYMEGCRLDEDEHTYSQAEAAYRRAIELDPSLANAITNLGNLLFRRGDVAEAERLYVRALQIDGEQPEAFYNLGFLLYERGELATAALNFRRALRSDPGFADAHFNLAMVLSDMGEASQARGHWETYLKLDPQSPWAEIARRHLGLS